MNDQVINKCIRELDDDWEHLALIISVGKLKKEFGIK
jgi:hypothetical protein